MGRDGKKANENDKLQPLRARLQSVPLVVQVFLTTIVTGLLRIIKYQIDLNLSHLPTQQNKTIGILFYCMVFRHSNALGP